MFYKFLKHQLYLNRAGDQVASKPSLMCWPGLPQGVQLMTSAHTLAAWPGSQVGIDEAMGAGPARL